MIYLAIFIYAAAMTLANMSVATFGPAVTPINAFVFIGLDLAIRDWLHTKLQPIQMGGLIAATGLLTYVLNPAIGTIALASAASFTVAAAADWFAFARINGSWARRSNGSNIVGAAVDSLVFPTLAFGVLMPHIVLAQFAAKVFGGFVWTSAINAYGQKNIKGNPCSQ